MKISELLHKFKINSKSISPDILNIELEESLDSFKEVSQKDKIITITGEENINTDPNDDEIVLRNITLTIDTNNEDETVILKSNVEDNFQQYCSWNKTGNIMVVG